MKHLVLINPSKGFCTGCIPLGLASISAYLKKYCTEEIRVTLLDANVEDIYKVFVFGDIYAITAVTQDIGEAIRYAEFIKSFEKRINGTLPVILGGVHISTYRVLPEPFDIGVIGEGENTMLELVNSDVSEWHGVKGVCFNVGGKTQFTEPRALIEVLDTIPIPDRDIANMDYYITPQQIVPYHSGRTLTMMTSRGCPFNCVFCSTKVHWQKFRAFSAERVIEEIKLLVEKYNAEIIHIFDDLFIVDKIRFRKIHDGILESGLNRKVKFLCLVRSDIIDDKTMRMLREMNVVSIGIGMESGCMKTLRYLKQNTTTVEKNRNAIRLAAKYNIPVMGSFMIGNPYETEHEILQTLSFIREYRYNPSLLPLTYIATAFPGTRFWAFAKAKGNPDTFDNIVMDIPNTIEPLKRSYLLTDIPVERFFELARLFDKELWYNIAKQHLLYPRSPIDIAKAYAIGVKIETNPLMGVAEITKILAGCINYLGKVKPALVPVPDVLGMNVILQGEQRELYKPIINQMYQLSPKMMSRKIPEAVVQQAFILNTVYNLTENIENPKILCVGAFEDTACDCLKKMGYQIDEVDPEINCDLNTYLEQHTDRIGTYDIVFSTSVIEHVPDDTAFVVEIAACLKQNGVAILTCDFNNDYKPGDRLPTTDMRFYTKESLTELMKSISNCSLVDSPVWNGPEDFVYEGIPYSFATLVFRKV